MKEENAIRYLRELEEGYALTITAEGEGESRSYRVSLNEKTALAPVNVSGVTGFAPKNDPRYGEGIRKLRDSFSDSDVIALADGDGNNFSAVTGKRKTGNVRVDAMNARSGLAVLYANGKLPL
jgi:hypothetical protein